MKRPVYYLLVEGQPSRDIQFWRMTTFSQTGYLISFLIKVLNARSTAHTGEPMCTVHEIVYVGMPTASCLTINIQGLPNIMLVAVHSSPLRSSNS